ncbi:basic amino acid/polyamine antiporter [Burkholderia anthinoferrum]|uniref:basic amino acid/polyamine antiporter n=1 Tax=Burkholderia anthinoferrum TaxID=3090833 RepID=UPI000CE21283|nr:basic amino acid/polyamine antiporter [Burkholderia anthinoferrum]
MSQPVVEKPPVEGTQPSKPAAGGPETRKLGLLLLSGIVVGSMIGGGAFNLPQNMAAGAGLGAIAIAWAITLVGMFFMSNAFRTLADQRPDLTAGIYSYAREGFGKFAGFEMAWGYWLSSAFGNVAFAVLIMQTLGYFFPVFDGKNWQSIVGCSLLIWTLHFMVLSGVKRVAILNTMASVVNIVTLSIAIVVIALFFQKGHFTFDVWGQQQHLGGTLAQIKSTMLVTLWVFIGIEGAVVVSDRARNQHEVGTATFIGLAVCTTLYFLLSVLPFGVMSQHQLAGLQNPSSAYVLEQLVGHWGAVFIVVALLFSVLSCWLAWTVLVAELPYAAARDGIFPRFLSRENRHHAAAPSLWLSSAVMQVMMFVVLFAHDAWIWLISVAGVMILPPYLASTGFLWKCSTQKSFHERAGEGKRASIWTGVLGTMYAAWLLYAAGPTYLLMSTIFFVVGIPVFWYAQREKDPQSNVFTGRERVAAGVLLVVAVSAVVLFAKGIVSVG